MLSVPLRPSKAHRRAEKDTGEEKGSHRSEIKGNDTPNDAAEVGVGKDAQVKEKELDFDKSDQGEVGRFRDPKELAPECKS